MWRAARILILSILTGSVLTHPVQGAEYPKQTIELLCPYAAGGSFDLYSRLIAEKVGGILGQPMVVINKPGAGGSTVVADLISSKPDGYKLGVLGSPYFATNVKTQKVPFDPSHVIPLMSFVEIIAGLKVKGDAPWKTLDELLKYGKQNPGKIRWGHSSRATTTYMNTTLIFRKAGVKAIDIPYKGAPESVTAILGGNLEAISQPHGAVAGHIKAGTLRYLVVFSDTRYSNKLPDVPCTKELGFEEAGKLKPLLGVWVHKDTPENVKKILIAALTKGFEDPEFKKGIEKIGDEPTIGGPELIMEAVKQEEKISVPLLKGFGMYVGN